MFTDCTGAAGRPDGFAPLAAGSAVRDGGMPADEGGPAPAEHGDLAQAVAPGTAKAEIKALPHQADPRQLPLGPHPRLTQRNPLSPRSPRDPANKADSFAPPSCSLAGRQPPPDIEESRKSRQGLAFSVRGRWLRRESRRRPTTCRGALGLFRSEPRSPLTTRRDPVTLHARTPVFQSSGDTVPFAVPTVTAPLACRCEQMPMRNPGSRNPVPPDAPGPE